MHEPSLKNIKKEWHGSYQAYAIGFVSSLLLTLTAFLLVYTKSLSGKSLVLTLVGLALTQAVLQMAFFLHVGQEPKPRWETLVFLFMLLILFIVILGSLWIMYDLNDRVMFEMNPEPIS